MRIVYHPKYLYGSAFINCLHPFQFDRAIQVEAMLRKELDQKLDELLLSPDDACSLDELAAVHDPTYLKKVSHSRVIASIVEVYALGWCPRFLMRRWFLDPTLWCTAGTVLAAKRVFSEGLIYNLGGGLHHAKYAEGEGFCLVSDIALAVSVLRREKLLMGDDSIFYIDTDVHQGNGVSTYFAYDPKVRILDVFSDKLYPFRDKVARAGIDVARPIEAGTKDDEYLRALQSGLDELFEGQERPKLVIYNAGTDVFAEDLLGDLKLSVEGVLKRDMLVTERVRGQGIPMVVLASGGYSSISSRLIANFALSALKFEEDNS